MKLSPVRIQQTLDQLATQAAVVPPDHPKAEELNGIFGDHTFFLDEDGLEIVEPAAPQGNGDVPNDAGQLVKLAMWNDAARTELAAHPAEVTNVIIHFESPVQEILDQAGKDSFPASDATTHSGVTRNGED
jgi:hypothetical protein